jgi:hypothetical protein
MATLLSLAGIAIYVAIIKPERAELKAYREKNAQKLDAILTKNELEKIIKDTVLIDNNEQTEKIVDRLKELHVVSCENMRKELNDSNVRLKEELESLNEIIVKFQEFLQEQDIKLENVVNEVSEISQILDMLYKAISQIIKELEVKGIIEKMDLVKPKLAFTNDDISNIAEVMSRILDKQNKNKITKILNRGQYEQI